MIHLHCVASKLSSFVQRFAATSGVDVTVYLRANADCQDAGGLCIYPLTPRREAWEAPLVSTELGWKLDGERSRLDFLLIRNAVREALKREPDVRHVLVSFPEDEFVARRVAEELELAHVACADGEG